MRGGRTSLKLNMNGTAKIDFYWRTAHELDLQTKDMDCNTSIPVPLTKFVNGKQKAGTWMGQNRIVQLYLTLPVNHISR